MKKNSTLESQSMHGILCSARLKKSECRFCGKSILLFFCDCGCMVLLEQAGDKWQTHSCQPGLNRFSGRDAFILGRTLGRKISEKELADGMPLTLAFETQAKEPENWKRTRTEAVRATFAVL